MSDKCECPARKALETALERIPTHAIRKVSSEFWEGGGSIVYHDWYLDLRAVLANCCHCAIVPDEVEHTFRELRTEYAELRENIDGWTKQCRALEPLVANRRDGESIIGAAAKEIEQLRAANADLRQQARESAYKAAQMRGIVDAAEKLLCGLYEHILPLSVHTREVMRDLRNALGDERGDSRQDRPTASGGSR